MAIKEKHVHDFKPTTKVVPLHNYVIERGKIVKDLISGKDTLKQFVCKCGAIETTDLIRNAKPNDPVSDLVVKSRKPTQTHTKSAQADPKRKANT